MKDTELRNDLSLHLITHGVGKRGQKWWRGFVGALVACLGGEQVSGEADAADAGDVGWGVFGGSGGAAGRATHGPHRAGGLLAGKGASQQTL